MGFRYRKSIKIMPGVRMNVSRSGIGYSAGVRGARVSRSPTGRVTRTLSLPGTGIGHTQTIGSGSSSARARSAAALTQVAPAAPPKPGMFAPAWEKALHKAMLGAHADPTALPAIARANPEHRVVIAALEGFMRMATGDNERTRALFAWVFAQRVEIADHPFVCTYLGASSSTIEIANGVSATLPLDTSTVALAVAELHQSAGDLDAAIATVEHIDPPTTVAALSLTELYLEAGRHQEVVELTQGITNTDDVGALLCVFRGSALREQGYNDAARESFKEALRVRSRPAEIRHRALLERAQSYMAQNRFAMARKDLERILAEDSSVPGLREALDRLPS